MTAEGLTIGLFEANNNLFRSITGLLHSHGCKVSPTARTIEEATTQVKTFSDHKTAAVFVGDFKYPDPEPTRILIAEILNNYPWVFTISMSTTTFNFGSNYDMFYGDVGAPGNMEWLLSQIAMANT